MKNSAGIIPDPRPVANRGGESQSARKPFPTSRSAPQNAKGFLARDQNPTVMSNGPSQLLNAFGDVLLDGKAETKTLDAFKGSQGTGHLLQRELVRSVPEVHAVAFGCVRGEEQVWVRVRVRVRLPRQGHQGLG